MTTPNLGERVLVVPQTWYILWRQFQGQDRSAVDRYTSNTYANNDSNKTPNQLSRPPLWWDTYPGGRPDLGTGLLVVRDGVFVRSIDHFDSSD